MIMTFVGNIMPYDIIVNGYLTPRLPPNAENGPFKDASFSVGKSGPGQGKAVIRRNDKPSALRKAHIHQFGKFIFQGPAEGKRRRRTKR